MISLQIIILPIYLKYPFHRQLTLSHTSITNTLTQNSTIHHPYISILYTALFSSKTSISVTPVSITCYSNFTIVQFLLHLLTPTYPFYTYILHHHTSFFQSLLTPLILDNPSIIPYLFLIFLSFILLSRSLY